MIASRDHSVDILKGIGIILVLVGHVFWSPWVGNVIFSFHIPLFVISSGYFISDSVQRHTFWGFFQNRFHKIVETYIFALLVFLAIQLIDPRFALIPFDQKLIGFKDTILLSNSYALENFNYSVYYWFLPPFFIFSILQYTVFRYLRKYLTILTICSFVLSIIIFYSSIYKVYDPLTAIWGFDKIPMFLTFGIIGYWIREKMVLLQKFSKVLLAISIIILYISSTLGFDYRTMAMPGILYGYVAALAGFWFAFFLARKLSMVKESDWLVRLLKFAGRNSLGILLTHGVVYPYMHAAMGGPSHNNISIIYNVTAITMSIVVYAVINYFDRILFKGILVFPRTRKLSEL